MNRTIVLMITLALLLIALIVSLVRRDRCTDSRINLDDLLLGEDGRLSKAAAVMMGAFALTSWLIVYLALTGRLTEGYFTAYLGAWVAPTVTALIVRRPSSSTPPA
jgi:hypothetical protein